MSVRLRSTTGSSDGKGWSGSEELGAQVQRAGDEAGKMCVGGVIGDRLAGGGVLRSLGLGSLLCC